MTSRANNPVNRTIQISQQTPRVTTPSTNYTVHYGPVIQGVQRFSEAVIGYNINTSTATVPDVPHPRNGITQYYATISALDVSIRKVHANSVLRISGIISGEVSSPWNGTYVMNRFNAAGTKVGEVGTPTALTNQSSGFMMVGEFNDADNDSTASTKSFVLIDDQANSTGIWTYRLRIYWAGTAAQSFVLNATTGNGATSGYESFTSQMIVEELAPIVALSAKISYPVSKDLTVYSQTTPATSPGINFTNLYGPLIQGVRRYSDRYRKYTSSLSETRNSAAFQYADIIDLNTTIFKKLATSKIKITGSIFYEVFAAWDVTFAMRRLNSSNIFVGEVGTPSAGTAQQGRGFAVGSYGQTADFNSTPNHLNFVLLDTAASTVGKYTYQLRIYASTSSTPRIFILNGTAGNIGPGYEVGTSQIIVEEFE